MPATTATPTIPELDELTRLKGRLQMGVVYLQRNWRNAARFASGRERLLDILNTAYLPGLREMLATHGRDTIEAEARTLEARMGRGWDVPGKRADDLFLDLLARYEVLVDTLRLDLPCGPEATVRARIAELEAVR
jgi:hypothetical protein